MLELKEVNLSETRFYQDVLQKGLEQGLGRVLQQGESDLVLRQLQKRCGILSITYGTRPDQLPPVGYANVKI